MIRTWHIEAFVIGSALALVVMFSSRAFVEWIGAFAVLASFMHAQIADRLAEREAARPTPDVECHRHAVRYFVAKESLWCVYFVVHRSWSALVGVGLFLAYPLWRKWYRSHAQRQAREELLSTAAHVSEEEKRKIESEWISK